MSRENRVITLSYEFDETLIKSLRNATAVLGYIYKACLTGTDVPPQFEVFKSKDVEALISEFSQLKKFCETIESEYDYYK